MAVRPPGDLSHRRSWSYDTRRFARDGWPQTILLMILIWLMLSFFFAALVFW